MVEMGLFDNEKVELLKGFIVRMTPQKRRHAGTTGARQSRRGVFTR